MKLKYATLILMMISSSLAASASEGVFLRPSPPPRVILRGQWGVKEQATLAAGVKLALGTFENSDAWEKPPKLYFRLGADFGMIWETVPYGDSSEEHVVYSVPPYASAREIAYFVQEKVPLPLVQEQSVTENQLKASTRKISGCEGLLNWLRPSS